MVTPGAEATFSRAISYRENVASARRVASGQSTSYFFSGSSIAVKRRRRLFLHIYLFIFLKYWASFWKRVAPE